MTAWLSVFNSRAMKHTQLFLKYFLVLGSLAGTYANAGKMEFIGRLSPAGSFKATNDEVTGQVTKVGDVVKADKVEVNMKAFKSGMDMRDQHIRDHLKAEQFPTGSLVLAEGKDGEGKAKVKLLGVEQEVKGTYKISGDTLTAEFKIVVSKLGITGVKYLGVGLKDEIEVKMELPIKTAAPK